MNDPNLTLPLHSVERDDLVSIKLWEAYLLYHPANLYRVLTALSADNGPLTDERNPGRVIFRFSAADWKNKIQPLLAKYRIPILNLVAKGNRTSSSREPAMLR